MLVEAPGLVRLRLELARAFFLKGEDELATLRFERVLAGNLPWVVGADGQGFLDRDQSTGWWSVNLGSSLVPDGEIGGTRQCR